MAISKRGLILIAIPLMSAGAVVTATIPRLSKGLALLNGPKALVSEVWQTINRDYIDGSFNGVDWQAVQQDYLIRRNYDSTEDAYDAIQEMLEKLQDPFTRFMDPEEYKSLQIDTSGELTGVGIQIDQDKETKNITVIAPIEDSPAAKAGILSGDVITKINGKSTAPMDLNQVVNLIRGPVNTKVTLTISRGQKSINFTITRNRIEVNPVRFSLRSTPQGNVGYIRLTQFSTQSAAKMQAAIRQLQQKQVGGYILDMRSNPGGLLFSSTEIADMWMDQGVIVSTVARQGEISRHQAKDGKLTEKPLVVLVDGGSASASEILAGALQDNQRAIVVGAKTFGKGSVQSVRPLGDGSGLAVTVAKYLTPSGRDIHNKGIEPDITVELSQAQLEQLSREAIGTLADPQYKKALTVLNEQILSAPR